MKLQISNKLTCGIRAACIISAVAAELICSGCSVKKIEYDKEGNKISYRIYENDHWLKTESTGIKGGMTKDGNFEFAAEGMKASPSEEFNRTMQTYTSAFIQLAQIAAAAYNPSASSAIQSAALKSAQSTSAESSGAATTQSAAQSTSAASAPSAGETTTPATDCKDGSCKEPAATDCKDCTPATK